MAKAPGKRKGFDFSGLEDEDDVALSKPGRGMSTTKIAEDKFGKDLPASSAMRPARLPTNYDQINGGGALKDFDPSAAQAQDAQKRIENFNKMDVPGSVELDNAEVFGAQIVRNDNELDQFRNDGGRQNDFSKNNYSAVGTQMEKSQHFTDHIAFADTMGKFQKISEDEVVQRTELKKSRQAIIAGRLLRIRAEIKQLDNQLNQSGLQQQSGENNKDELESLHTLKDQLESIYKTSGFKALLKQNELATKLQDAKSVQKEQLDLQELVNQLKDSNLNGKADEEQTMSVDLVVDRSQKHIGTLIRLNSLQKRVHFIKHFMGEWKPTPKYKNISQQIEHVQKLLELMDSQRITYYQKRVETLLGELDAMSGPQGTLSTAERMEQYGHPKEFIDKLHKSCQQVRATMDAIPKYVERMEQKKKLHEMSAQIMLDVQTLECQQRMILERFSENKELLSEVGEGMTENLKIAQANVEVIKKAQAVPDSSTK